MLINTNIVYLFIPLVFFFLLSVVTAVFQQQLLASVTDPHGKTLFSWSGGSRGNTISAT